MQRLFYLKSLLNNINVRLSCHEKNKSDHSLALATRHKNNEIVLYHFYDQSPNQIIRIPWIIQTGKRVEALCFNPTLNWLLIITGNNSLCVVPTYRPVIEKKNHVDLKWSTTDVTIITDDVPADINYSKPVKLIWWQRKNLNQNAFIGYEDGTIRLVSLENGSCLDSCKVNDRIHSMNLCPNKSSSSASLLIQGKSGQKWRLILELQFIGSVWEASGNSRKALRFRPIELLKEGVPELSSFKCCVICAISEESDSLISSSNESYFSRGELDLSVEILESHFNFSENEKVLDVYKIMDSDYFDDRDYGEASCLMKVIFPSLIENVKSSKPAIEGYLVVTDIGIYKISLSCFVINRLIDLAINENFGLATGLATVFGLNLLELLEICGDLMVGRGKIDEGLKMYENARIHPLKKISKISHHNEALINFGQIYLATNKHKIATKTKIYMTNLIVMAYVQIISKEDDRLKYTKYEEDFLNFIRHEEFYDPNLIFKVICKSKLWNVASVLAITHGFQNELVAALSQTVASFPRLIDIRFFMILSEPNLTLNFLVEPQCCAVILRYLRRNLHIFPLRILRRFINQLDLSDNFNVFETTIDDRVDHKREIIETFILLVMQLLNLTKKSSFSNNISLLQRLKPVKEVRDNRNLKSLYKFSELSCGYKYAAVIRNDNVYTMGNTTSGILGIGPTEKLSNPPKLVHTLDALNAIVWSVSCGKKHTLALTDRGVFSWGSNIYGQLGISSLNRQSPYPNIISSLKDEPIVAVVAGQYHSMALTAAGLVFTWGWGIHGQLGHGTTNDEYIPRLLTFNRSVVKIAAGYAHSLILTSEGMIYGFGSNVYGQLARENLYGRKSSIPIQIVLLCNVYIQFSDIASGYFQNVVIREQDNSLYTWGTTPKYVRLKKNSKKKPLKRWKSPRCIPTPGSINAIEKIVVGLYHVVILYCGVLYVCKDMEERFIKVRTIEQNNSGKFTSVSCGSDFMLARSKTGRLFFWGSDALAKTLMGKLQDNAKEPFLPSSFQSHLESGPVEILGLPSIIITYHPVDHSSKISKSILKPICSNSSYKFEQETLMLILENYFGYYNTENIMSKCLEMGNLLAASKVAILNEQFGDSFVCQLKAIESGKLITISIAEIREDTTAEGWKILRDVIEFYIECTYSLQCKIHIESIINMCIEFWINNSLPVINLEDILLPNVDKLLNPLFDLVFCEYSNSNFHEEEFVENEEDDKKIRNQKVCQFLKSFSNNLKLKLCSSIVKCYNERESVMKSVIE